MDLLAPFEKHCSDAQLGLTPHHIDTQRNTAMPGGIAMQRSIAMLSFFQKRAFLIEKRAVAAQFALERAGSDGAIDLASLNMLFL